MLALNDRPFPFEACRDLLGVLRGLWAAAGEGRRPAIERAARELLTALEMASQYEPGSLGHSAAWNRAERVVAGLGALVDMTTPAEPVLAAAGLRVRRPRR